MTLEEKQLLLKDLCARLPYGVICKLSTKGTDVSITEKLGLSGLEHFIFGTMDVLPYLRPISSITQDEIDEYFLEFNKDLDLLLQAMCDKDLNNRMVGSDGSSASKKFILHFGIDWLNAHHFDFRGLIEKSLALEAPEGMYKTE